jgi:hypothetical protein
MLESMGFAGAGHPQNEKMGAQRLGTSKNHPQIRRKALISFDYFIFQQL